jgi:hypothetical protein
MSSLDKIRAGIRNHQVVAWPGTSSKVKIRVLSRGELQEAVFAAENWFRTSEIPVTVQLVEEFEAEKTTQILFRALSSVEDDKPLCSDIDVFRSTIPRSEQSALAELYELLEEECSPNPDSMPDKQFDEFVQTLKKKPDEMIGSVRSIAFARRLLRSLVSPPIS